jgi:hypothetical protein
MVNKNNEGIVLANSIIIMSILIVLGISLISLILANSAFINKEIQSTKALGIAEAGIERALWQLNQPNSSYNGELDNQSVEGGAFDIIVEDIDSDSKYITAISYSPSKQNAKSTKTVRVKIETSYAQSGAAFHYGVQVGDFGLDMKSNNTRVNGNVYSNGNIEGAGVGKAIITGTASVAGATNKIENMSIYMDAYANTISGSAIGGKAYYNINFSNTATEKFPNSPDPAPSTMPISQETIDNWKSAAQAGGVLNGNQTINSPTSLGPKKINGNLTVNDTLTLTGVLWVTGNITAGNGVTIQLDQSYGANSGMIIADSETDKVNYGKIDVENNVILKGTSNVKSFMLMISTNIASSYSNPAIRTSPNSSAVVYYGLNGWVYLKNNAHVKSVVGKGLHIENNADVTYDSGLASANFVSGPGGVWVIAPKSWEIL